MTVVYRKSDVVKVKVHDLEVHLNPLTHHDKNQIQSLLVSGNVDGLMAGATMALKCAIKDVKGLKLPDGSDYKLEFEGGKLSDEAIDDLLNLKCQGELSAICIAMVNGIPDEFINPETGEVYEGVKIMRDGDSEKKD